MNDKRMKFIMFGSNRQLDKCTSKEITVGEDVIQRAEVIKLLVVKLDKILSFKEHMTDKCRKVTLNLHNIRKSEIHLMMETLKAYNKFNFFSHLFCTICTKSIFIIRITFVRIQHFTPKTLYVHW